VNSSSAGSVTWSEISRNADRKSSTDTVSGRSEIHSISDPTFW
jgi:hypothetical protein